MKPRTWIISAFALAAAIGAGGVVLRRHAHPTMVDDEDAALDEFHEMRARGETVSALKLLMRCAMKTKGACRCADLAGEYSVDLGQPERGWAPVMHTHCPNTARHVGERAELFAARGMNEDAQHEAERGLALDAREPHANFALAWALSASGAPPRALEAAETAVTQGRGTPALLLLAKLRSAAGDDPGAHRAIEQAAEQAPSDPRVAFDIGVLEQGAGHYHQAREAYLKALAANPKYADARYNLAVLAHSIHADAEARHDLDELIAIAPGEPRISALRAEMSGDAGP